ncbi:MAG: hypothetical protein DRJ38_08715 [Thermoprotei archaeon]|nr:MAG: hypothetical protein DRJ38_08715 [Thermoprotei archaeon]
MSYLKSERTVSRDRKGSIVRVKLPPGPCTEIYMPDHTDILTRSEELLNFLEKPYLILPQRDHFLLIVPRWIPLRAGWLISQTESYNVYRVDQYALWAGLIPEELKDEFDLKPRFETLRLVDTYLVGSERELEEAWRRYRPDLLRREPGRGLRVKSGRLFSLAIKLVRDGIIPWSPRPVKARWSWKTTVRLRQYQEEALKFWLEHGFMVLIWPFGAGKTYLAVKAIEAVSGKTLIVIPSVSLIGRWKSLLEEVFLPPKPSIGVFYGGRKVEGDIVIATYESAIRHLANKEWELVVFDEAHHYPADRYSQIAMIKRKYQLCLTGSPFREDGRTELIYALGGPPYGSDWERLVSEGWVRKPPIYVHVTPAKLTVLVELLRKLKGRGLIFCDTIALGEELSRITGLPFVHGAHSLTRRMKILEKHERLICSRIFDEGMDIPDLAWVIEVDFLYGCYDDQTEVLTRDGWKRFQELTYEDEVATLNPNGYIEYHKPIEIHKYWYEGELIHFKGKNYDLLVTPNHEMYVRDHRKNEFTFKKAEELASLGGGLRNYELKKDAKWRGVDVELFEIPQEFLRAKAPKRKSGPTNFRIEPFLEFLGWYLAEGSIWGGNIQFAQTNPRHREKLVKIVEEMALKPKLSPDKIITYNRPLARYLAELGTAKRKFVPKLVKELPPDKLELFLMALMKGDGKLCNPEHGTFTYYTTSKRLADDIQEIAIKCGYATTLSQRTRIMNGAFRKGYRHTEYALVITKRHTTPQINCRPKIVGYRGWVYCVTVPNHVILVRRNGKAVWCGNSRRQELQRVGRLMHTIYEGVEYHLLMTPEEFEKYRKRLYGLFAKGFEIKIIKGG